MSGGRPSKYSDQAAAIYALHDVDGEVRYVGKARDPVKRFKWPPVSGYTTLLTNIE